MGRPVLFKKPAMIGYPEDKNIKIKLNYRKRSLILFVTSKDSDQPTQPCNVSHVISVYWKTLVFGGNKNQALRL